MKKIVFFASVLISASILARVGINEINSTAILDIKSKGNTTATKALEVNNSSRTEFFTVFDNGNVGVNVPNLTVKLHTNGRYENLPIVSGSGSPLAIKSDGTGRTYVPEPTKYLYMEMVSSVTTSSFSLSDTGGYTSIPLASTQSVNYTTTGGFGTNASATLNVNNTAISSSNVRYISFPDPGIYKINLSYYTSCSPEKCVGRNSYLWLWS